MLQYQNFLQHILDNGRWSDNRTGTPTKKCFGWQMQFDLKAGFPLVTTKKLHIPAIVHELLWFIAGDTNNQTLNEHNVKIWNEWALSENQTTTTEIHFNDRVKLLAKARGINHSRAFDLLHQISTTKGYSGALDELNRAGVPTHEETVIREAGALGPIYGHQWRSWGTGAVDTEQREVTLDQLSHAIHQLRTNPNSRRILVNAWNVKDLPDESVSPQENVHNGKMALAPCHVMFQFGTQPLTTVERAELLVDRYEAKHEADSTVVLDDYDRAYYEYRVAGSVDDAEMSQFLDEEGIPKYTLDCHLYQRSCDAFLGASFNIASYALLTHMVAQVVNMVPGKFVHSFGDIHIYENHIEQVQEQLTREPYPLPILKLNPDVKELTDFKASDIEVLNYQCHPSIKGKVAV